MNHLLTALIWVTVGSSVGSLALEQTQNFPTPELGIVEARCPSNCQGDFPVPSGRKYADRESEASAVVRG